VALFIVMASATIPGGTDQPKLTAEQQFRLEPVSQIKSFEKPRGNPGSQAKPAQQYFHFRSDDIS